MEHNMSLSESMANIKLSGQLIFSDTKKFKEILDLTSDSKIKSINLDFSNVTFIDSSGMGMLLLLRDECQTHNISLNIHSPHGQVDKIFKISKFYDIFSIK